MSIVYLAIPLSIILGTSLFMGFLWSVRSGQLDDMETPAHRMLIDQDSNEMKEKI